jgi:hypothetical protein
MEIRIPIIASNSKRSANTWGAAKWILEAISGNICKEHQTGLLLETKKAQDIKNGQTL